MSENYMNKFKTSEDFIRCRTTSRDGVISKAALIEVAKNSIEVNSKMKMVDIYDTIRSTVRFIQCFDYFRLTKDEVHQFLTLNPKGTRKMKKTGE